MRNLEVCLRCNKLMKQSFSSTDCMSDSRIKTGWFDRLIISRVVVEEGKLYDCQCDSPIDYVVKRKFEERELPEDCKMVLEQMVMRQNKNNQ